MADLFDVVDSAPTHRRLKLRGQATISILLTQIPGKREPGKPRPDDRFMLRMVLVEPRPAGRPRKTTLSTKEVDSEEEAWICLRDLATNRLLTLGQLEPPKPEDM